MENRHHEGPLHSLKPIIDSALKDAYLRGAITPSEYQAHLNQDAEIKARKIAKWNSTPLGRLNQRLRRIIKR